MRPLIAWCVGIGLSFSIHAQTFSVLHTFDYPTDGAYPYGGLLVLGTTLYGTASAGGSGESGTLFRLSIDGSDFTAFKHFSPLLANANLDGAAPLSGLIYDGTILYGTTSIGGIGGGGTVFRAQPDGTNLVVLHAFTNSPDGYTAYGGVLLSDGLLFGATEFGGPQSEPDGVVYKVGTNGAGYSVAFDYNGYSTNGANPTCTFIRGPDALYGTATTGGGIGTSWGVVYKATTNGALAATLHVFGYFDGDAPYASLLLAGNSLYGTTASGGEYGYGTVFRIDTDGTGFRLLHSFTNSPDGSNPYASLILISNQLYGTTTVGGSTGYGTVFQLDTNGTSYRVLKHFQNGADGAQPYGNLAAIGNTLYGTASAAGSKTYGTIYKIDLGGPVPIPLHIANTQTNAVVLWWLPGNRAYTLQTNANLATQSWGTYAGTIFTNGATHSALAKPPSGEVFFRLVPN